MVELLLILYHELLLLHHGLFLLLHHGLAFLASPRGGVAFAGAVCGSPIFGGTRVQSFSQRVRRGGWSGCYARLFWNRLEVLGAVGSW
ncbi:hypothetical protein ACSQ67_000479 [Phaseolus vulgaris]